jgi:hypothetical protein
MKKLLIAVACLCSTTSYAQSQRGGAVMLTPDVGQGYLVLNKAEHPDVEAWSVNLKERTFDPNGTATDVTLDRITLKNNINYWRVPNKYLNSESVLLVEVTGLNSNNTAVVTEAALDVSDAPSGALEVGGTPALLGCSWVCNGSYYAWEIQQYVEPDLPTAGPSRLEVQTALNFNQGTQTAIPNYRYITQGEFANACLDQNGNNLGGFFIPGVPCSPEGIWMTGPINITQSTSTYPDINGNSTPGPIVYGVGKPLGAWDGGNPIVPPELNFGNTVCGNDVWWAMNMVNNNEPTSNGYPMDGTGNNYYPELECNQPVSGGVGEPDVDHEFGEPDFQGELLE